MIIIAAASAVAAFWETVTVMNVSIILLAVLSNLTVLQRSIYVYSKSKRNEVN
jgi:hypothetical protein